MLFSIVSMNFQAIGGGSLVKRQMRFSQSCVALNLQEVPVASPCATIRF